MKDALCAGSAPNKREDPEAEDIFFPEKGESYNKAILMCMQCPVMKECREYRRRTGSNHGMWGAEKGKQDD